MNVVPLGGVQVSAAGSPLQQTRGKDTDRTAQDVSNQQRTDKLNNRAEAAAGVGETEEDQGASDRDADGRKLWESSPERKAKDQDSSDQPEEQRHQPKDATGTAGNSLDLTG